MLFVSSEKESSAQEQAFLRQLYETYGRLMYSIARKCIPDPHDQEDLVQETILKLAQKLSLLQTLDDTSLAAYVAVSVRNNAYSRLRKQAVEEKRVLPWCEDLEKIPSPAPSFEEQIISREQMQTFLEVWRELPEEDRFLLEGRYILRCTDQELASGLGCQPASVRMKLTRLRKKVLAQMQKKELAK